MRNRLFTLLSLMVLSQILSGCSEFTFNEPRKASQIEPTSILPPPSKAAFANTVYRITRRDCTSCHSAGPLPPPHAAADLDTAFAAAKPFADFANIPASRFIARVKDGHCGTKCATDGAEMSAAIVAWAAGEAPTGEICSPSQQTQAKPSHKRIVRLTHEQYDNAVRDLFKFPADRKYSVQLGFDKDVDADGFSNNAEFLRVGSAQTRKYQVAAQKISQDVMSSPEIYLAGKWPCTYTAADFGSVRTCVRPFVRIVAAQAFRQPATAGQVSALMNVYDLAKTAYADNAKATGAVLEAILQMPAFLYRTELGAEAQDADLITQLTAYELAAFLSFTIWNTIPDQELTQVAASGALLQDSVASAQVERLLASPRSQSFFENFVVDWLDLHELVNLPTDHPIVGGDPALAERLPLSMEQEVRLMTREVLQQDEGRLSGLFTANFNFADAALAQIYGTAAPKGTNFKKVSLDSRQRQGLLTTAAVLAAFGEPTRAPGSISRGYLVRTKLLCQELPPTPPGLENTVPPPQPDLTERERLARTMANPVCLNCHQSMNPIGYGFLHYDGIGRFRTVEGGQPVDAAGELRGTSDNDGLFVGAVELSSRLATSDDVKSCASRQAMKFTFGRSITAGDECSIAKITSEYKAGGAKLPDLLKRYLKGDLLKARAKE